MVSSMPRTLMPSPLTWTPPTYHDILSVNPRGIVCQYISGGDAELRFDNDGPFLVTMVLPSKTCARGHRHSGHTVLVVDGTGSLWFPVATSRVLQRIRGPCTTSGNPNSIHYDVIISRHKAHDIRLPTPSRGFVRIPTAAGDEWWLAEDGVSSDTDDTDTDDDAGIKVAGAAEYDTAGGRAVPGAPRKATAPKRKHR
jgi:hypothetical protein